MSSIIKICTKCKVGKTFDKFNKSSCSKDGYHYCCKECRKEFYQQNKEKILKHISQYRLENRDRIRERKRKDYQKNKEKKKQKTRQWYRKNREYALKYKKQYYFQHREEITEYKKEWGIKNKDKIRQRKCNWCRVQRRFNPLYKLRHTVSRTINFALKRNNYSKCGSSILKYLPYTIQQLKEHLEKQFEPWMSWKNHGNYRLGGKRKWHIDHIYPHSKLSYDSMQHPNFQKAWALENLRPLEAIVNMSKGAKLINS